MGKNSGTVFSMIPTYPPLLLRSRLRAKSAGLTIHRQSGLDEYEDYVSKVHLGTRSAIDHEELGTPAVHYEIGRHTVG